MLLILFALSVSSQPLNGGFGAYYGAGTPAPRYAVPSGAARGLYVPNARQVGSPRVGLSQNEFDLLQINRAVRASELDARGNRYVYNLPIKTVFPHLLDIDPQPLNPYWEDRFNFRYGAFNMAASNKLDEHRIQAEIDYFRRTHPQLTQEDRNHLDDLILQRESARNQKLRRFVQTSPIEGPSVAGLGLAPFFERRANEHDLNLAQNALYDVRSDFREEQTRDNLLGLHNARDDVDQADARRDANTLELLDGVVSEGSLDGLSKYAPVLRKKASRAKLEIGYRSLRLAQKAFDEDPSEINRMKVKLANLFIDATEQENSGNTNDMIANTIDQSGFSQSFTRLNSILSAKNFQDEAAIWLRYDQLRRRILIREQAAAAQEQVPESNQVAQQMLGLSMYGPAAGSTASGRSTGGPN